VIFLLHDNHAGPPGGHERDQHLGAARQLDDDAIAGTQPGAARSDVVMTRPRSTPRWYDLTSYQRRRSATCACSVRGRPGQAA
jgi:hypothetical protein